MHIALQLFNKFKCYKNSTLFLKDFLNYFEMLFLKFEIDRTTPVQRAKIGELAFQYNYAIVLDVMMNCLLESL